MSLISLPLLPSLTRNLMFDIRSNTTAALRAIPQNQFQNCFEGWTRRWHRYIASQVKYVLWRQPQWYSAMRYVALLPQWVHELYCQTTYFMNVCYIVGHERASIFCFWWGYFSGIRKHIRKMPALVLPVYCFRGNCIHICLLLLWSIFKRKLILSSVMYMYAYFHWPSRK
jgi:hypothetical protein